MCSECSVFVDDKNVSQWFITPMRIAFVSLAGPKTQNAIIYY